MAPAPPQSLAQIAADYTKSVGRQVGLTARYGMEGLGQAAEVVTEPVRHWLTDPLMRAMGVNTEGSKPLGQAMTGVADRVGLPKPANETERVVGDTARFMAGGAGMAGAAGKVAQAAAPVTAALHKASGPLQMAFQAMAANPGMQIAGSAGAGIGAGLAREAGGGEGAQLAAGLAGGLGVSGLVQAARSGVQSASVLIPIRAKRVEQQIEQAMGNAGVSWQEVPEGIRQGMRVEAEKALRSGTSLNADALVRLLDFKRVGATPTRGTLSLDPVQITREQNLARTGANSSDTGLQGLARVQNENNRTLIDSLNRLGAASADDAVNTGERLMGSLQRGLDADKLGIDALYAQARDSAGRSASLDGHAFTTQASQLLDDNLLGGALPSSVQTHLNRIAMGEVPFNVNYAEQLKTAIGKLQRASSDGQQRMALGMVRQALDDTPLMEAGRGGATAGRPAAATAGAELGEQALDAFNRARLANRTMMQRVESMPGLKAVYEGKATPDDFVQRYVISTSAKAQDTGRLAQELRANDPQSLEAVRSSIALHLKQAAIGAAADETGRFGASGYNRALLALGAKKLSQFFDKDEIAMLKAVGNVSQYTTVQPVGSAVNNSNSGALLMGRGLDMLDRLSAKVPLLGIGQTVSGITKGVQQRQAQSIASVLARKPGPEARRLPGATFGTLMAGTGEN
ncbi:hypothetical protein ACFIQF_19185 [Comamonas sp. J-3]|uniref:hypothetical protein n=1 Tax=Comamonas trifloxystrobinivorans TaxID=3350256 RepID=UPI003727BA10